MHDATEREYLESEIKAKLIREESLEKISFVLDSERSDFVGYVLYMGKRCWGKDSSRKCFTDEPNNVTIFDNKLSIEEVLGDKYNFYKDFIGSIKWGKVYLKLMIKPENN